MRDLPLLLLDSGMPSPATAGSSVNLSRQCKVTRFAIHSWSLPACNPMLHASNLTLSQYKTVFLLLSFTNVYDLVLCCKGIAKNMSM